jgi:hypothetical protein
VKLLTRPRAETANAPTVTSSAAPAPAATPAPAGCGIVQPAARLASSVHRPVAPLVTAAIDGTRASIGFAEAENDAVGITVDLVTLDVERVFRQVERAKVRFVVPLALDSKRSMVDRDDGKTQALRSVDTEPPFGLGTSERDWVRATGRSTGVLWAGEAGEKTTDPHVASGPSGHLVTFRRGGLSGRVLYGFLGPDGSAKGELRFVDAPGVRFSGTPDAALGEKSWLVAFAGRATPEEEWAHRARAENGRRRSDVQFQTPPAAWAGAALRRRWRPCRRRVRLSSGPRQDGRVSGAGATPRLTRALGEPRLSQCGKGQRGPRRGVRARHAPSRCSSDDGGPRRALGEQFECP